MTNIENLVKAYTVQKAQSYTKNAVEIEEIVDGILYLMGNIPADDVLDMDLDKEIEEIWEIMEDNKEIE